MSQYMINMLAKGLWQTIEMTLIAAVIATIVGVVLGVILVTTSRGHILENKSINASLGMIVNIMRSIPFIILMVAIIPFTRLVVGTSIGTIAATVPLTIASIPFLARLVETSLREVPYGLVEAAQTMGATPMQIIYKVLLPEAMPTIIDNITVLLVNLIGYSAMAGAVGGGGLGDIAIRYGYQRFNVEIMLITIIMLIVIVQCMQSTGDFIAKRLNKK